MKNKILRVRGFTLIELLVVIAIIAILAAILFPVFARVREKANQTHCINTQRQLMIAIQSYAQDNDETLPLPSEWIAKTGLSDSPKLFRCPSSTNTKAAASHPDYGMNANLYDTVNGDKVGLSIGSIETPDKVEVTVDISGMTTVGPFPNSFSIPQLKDGNNADYRHAGGLIMSFLDGHVQRLGPKDLPVGMLDQNLMMGLLNYQVNVDLSTVNSAVAAQSAMLGIGPFNTVRNTGTWNAANHTWDVTGTGTTIGNYNIGSQYQSVFMDVTFTLSGSAEVYFANEGWGVQPSAAMEDKYFGAQNNQNVCHINQGTGNIEFGIHRLYWDTAQNGTFVEAPAPNGPADDKGISLAMKGNTYRLKFVSALPGTNRMSWKCADDTKNSTNSAGRYFSPGGPEAVFPNYWGRTRGYYKMDTMAILTVDGKDYSWKGKSGVGMNDFFPMFYVDVKNGTMSIQKMKYSCSS